MEKTIKAYMLRVVDGVPCKGYIGEIDNTLKSKQKYVDGIIQVVSLDSSIDIICNDEGKLQGLSPNRAFMDGEDILDVFVGNILACRHDNEGNFTSIKEEDIPVIEDCLKPLGGIMGEFVFLKSTGDLPEFQAAEGVKDGTED